MNHPSSINSYAFIALIDLYSSNVTARDIKPFLSFFCTAAEIALNASALNVLSSRIVNAVKHRKRRGDIVIVRANPEQGLYRIRQQRGATVFRHSLGGSARHVTPASSFHRIWLSSPNP